MNIEGLFLELPIDLDTLNLLGTAKYAKEFYNKCQIKKLIKANLLKTRNLKDFSDNSRHKLLSSLYFESFGIKAKGGAIYRAIF